MTDQLAYLEQQLIDAVADLADCEHAEADGRVVDRERWLTRYWTLRDRVLELERKVDTLRNASGATETRS